MAFFVDNDEPHFDEALLAYVKKGGTMEVLQSFVQNKNCNLVDSDGRTILHYAAETNNVSMTKYCIEQKYNIDMLDYDGNSPVMLAVQSFSVDTAKILIESGACIYFLTNRGTSILPDRPFCTLGESILGNTTMSEIVSKYPNLVKIILEKVRKDCWHDEQLLVSRLRYLDCSLVKLMYLQDANITRLMLIDGYSVDEIEPESNETALHLAVKFGDYETVEVLLEYGANVHILDKSMNLPPIYYYDESSTKGTDLKVKILKILIQNGALATRSEGIKPPAEYILSVGKLWAINTLMQYDFEWHPRDSLYALVSNKNPDVLEAIHGKEIDVNSADNPLELPVLFEAIMLGKLQKVEYLLKAGANPNFIDEQGWSILLRVLEFGVEKKNLSIIWLLLEYGIDTQFVSQSGLSIFDFTRYSGHDNVFESIIAHFAMVESVGETITDFTREKINSQHKLKSHYKKCKQQLKKMKNEFVYESVTLYKLLTENQSKILGYARNQELIRKFKERIEMKPNLDLYYTITLSKRVGIAIHRTRLKEEAVLVLTKIFETSVGNYYDILSRIVDYLTCNDLKNICKVYEVEECDSYNSDIIFK